MKLFFLKFFTWWSGQTFGTQLWTWRFGELVGEDEQGNRYYRTKGRKIDPSLGFERRWVVYNGYAEATRVPPSWHGWLHHTVDVAPTEETYKPHEWEKPHIPNMTGTPAAYRPSGLDAGQRPPARGHRRLSALDAAIGLRVGKGALAPCPPLSVRDVLNGGHAPLVHPNDLCHRSPDPSSLNHSGGHAALCPPCCRKKACLRRPLLGHLTSEGGGRFMRRISNLLLGAVIGAGLTVLAIQPPSALVAAAKAAAGTDTYSQLNLFGDVFERIKAGYVEKPDDAKLVEGAINGMITRARSSFALHE